MYIFDREKLAKELNKKIKQERLKKKPVYKIYSEMDISHFVYNNFRNGDIPGKTSIDTIEKVINWLDIPPHEFFKEVEE